MAKSVSVRLIHFFIFCIFFEFFFIIFVLVFSFFSFFTSPPPPSVGLITPTFRGGLGGSGGVWRLWERSGRIYFGGVFRGGVNYFLNVKKLTPEKQAPTSARMSRARPAPSASRPPTLARDMRVELGRGRVDWG